MEPLRRLLLWCAALLAIVGALPAVAQTVIEVTCSAGACDTDTERENTAYAACVVNHPFPDNSKCVPHSATDSCGYAHTRPGVGSTGYYTGSGTWNGVCYDIPLVEIYQTVEPCAATANQSISGTVGRTGEPSASNPPPQQVCHESCLYGLSSAVAATGLDGTELWSGTWIGEGQSCPDTSPPPSPGTGEEGETSEGAAANDATKSGDDADAAHAALLEDWRLNSIASRSNPSTQSPIGDFFSLPSWVTGLFDPPATDCNLHIDLSGGTSLGFIASAVSSTDVCEVQGIADTYGNWFMWFCAVVWSWAIVVGRGD